MKIKTWLTSGDVVCCDNQLEIDDNDLKGKSKDEILAIIKQKTEEWVLEQLYDYGFEYPNELKE